MKKAVLLWLLLSLPSIFLRVYVELSFYIYIMKVRKGELLQDDINVQPLRRLLNLSFNDDSVILPFRTYDWIWGEAGEDHLIKIGDSEISVTEMLRDSSKSSQHCDELVTFFINRLPKKVLAKLAKGPSVSESRNIYVIREDFSRVVAEC
jgi:hypothetical protein